MQMLEQAHLPVVAFLRHKVQVAVNCAFAHSRLEGKLVHRLFAVVRHVTAHGIRSHPGWAGYMVARKAFPDSFGDIETEGLRDPL